MAIDPARIQARMLEAERSGRSTLGAQEARAALRVLAVVMDEEPQNDQQHSDAAALVRAS
ncbi:hypothetical protein PV342_12930 [Streptomyces sp. PA03-3a]|nr:hypothetical protein [Streptomyces sp. PA03-3a]